MKARALLVGLAALACFCGVAAAQDQKSFRLDIGSNSVEIDPGESVEITLPDGSKAQATLTANPFQTYRAGAFSFVHPSAATVTQSDLGGGITQHMMASAVGTMVIVQTYDTLDPSGLVDMMLTTLTKDAVAIGAKVEQSPHSRVAGQELTGLTARETGTDKIDYEILAHGAGRSGVIVITRIDDENKKADGHLIDKFWESLKVN